MQMNIDNLKIGKRYSLNKRDVAYMGMFSDMAAPLAGFHLFVSIEDGVVKALRKTDMLEDVKLATTGDKVTE